MSIDEQPCEHERVELGEWDNENGWIACLDCGKWVEIDASGGWQDPE